MENALFITSLSCVQGYMLKLSKEHFLNTRTFFLLSTELEAHFSLLGFGPNSTLQSLLTTKNSSFFPEVLTRWELFSRNMV